MPLRLKPRVRPGQPELRLARARRAGDDRESALQQSASQAAIQTRNSERLSTGSHAWGSSFEKTAILGTVAARGKGVPRNSDLGGERQFESWAWKICTQEPDGSLARENLSAGTGVPRCRSRIPVPPQQADLDALTKAIREAVDGETLSPDRPPRLEAVQTTPGADRIRGPRPRPRPRRQGPPDRPRRAEKRGYRGSSMTCPHCGDEFHSHRGYRPQRRLPAGGEPPPDCSYYQSGKACGIRGIAPFDHEAGLTARDLTPALERHPGLAGTSPTASRRPPRRSTRSRPCNGPPRTPACAPTCRTRRHRRVARATRRRRRRRADGDGGDGLQPRPRLAVARREARRSWTRYRGSLQGRRSWATRPRRRRSAWTRPSWPGRGVGGDGGQLLRESRAPDGISRVPGQGVGKTVVGQRLKLRRDAVGRSATLLYRSEPGQWDAWKREFSSN